ncbi:UNVERIFIED_CONTAM: hypothetical protein FKN15_016610 [Acipenser sinensis]
MEHWSIRLKRQVEQDKWEEVMSVDDESTGCYCLIDSHSCLLLLEQPGTYSLVGEPLTEAAVKRLKLAAFGSMSCNALDYSLRVYCVDDTPHAFQEVVANEKSRGGQLLEEPKTLLFKGNTFSLQVSIQDIPQFLWSIKPFTTCQEFPFSQVWCSNQQPLHCAFSLERYSPATTQLSCKISVRQVKGHEQILQVYTSVVEEVMSVDDESTGCYCLIDSHSCLLLLEQPGTYSLVGEPLTEAAVKRLKLAAFGSMSCNALDYSLRVYCVDDTPHAFQEVVANEKSRGGQLLEEPKTLLFKGNTFSLQVSIQDIPQFLWSIKPFTTCQVHSTAQRRHQTK